MIKVKNSDLNDTTSNAFQELLNLDLPISLSWKIAKLAKEIDALIILKKETINNLITKHSIKDEEGKMILIEDSEGIYNTTQISNPDLYNKEIVDFESIYNEITFEPISIKVLEENNTKIKPSFFFNLSFMFTD